MKLILATALLLLCTGCVLKSGATFMAKESWIDYSSTPIDLDGDGIADDYELKMFYWNVAPPGVQYIETGQILSEILADGSSQIKINGEGAGDTVRAADMIESITNNLIRALEKGISLGAGFPLVLIPESEDNDGTQ